MKPVFYPYKLGSESAKILSAAFNSERVRPNGEFRNNFKRPVINWGNSERPAWMNRWPTQIILNKPEAVKKASNKLVTFQVFKEMDVPHPEWTTNKEDAAMWTSPPVARKTLTGKGGEGIIIVKDGELIPDAPLYTKYFKKKFEYRVHVFDGKVIDYVVKKKREGVEVNYQVRNHEGGWVFCREGVVLPQCVADAAIKAVAALGLSFGAVDVGYNETKGLPSVFEVNTAPGLEGTTVVKYAEAIKEILK